MLTDSIYNFKWVQIISIWKNGGKQFSVFKYCWLMSRFAFNMVIIIIIIIIAFVDSSLLVFAYNHAKMFSQKQKYTLPPEWERESIIGWLK